MQNLEWYPADLKSTGKNSIETVEKSLTDMFIRLVRIYPCLLVFVKIETSSKTRDIFYVILDTGHMVKNRDCPAKLEAVGKYVYPDIFFMLFSSKRIVYKLWTYNYFYSI